MDPTHRRAHRGLCDSPGTIGGRFRRRAAVDRRGDHGNTRASFKSAGAEPTRHFSA